MSMKRSFTEQLYLSFYKIMIKAFSYTERKTKYIYLRGDYSGCEF